MVWEFLADPDNQKTLAFYGGGAAVVSSALWTAFLALRKKPSPPPPKQPTNQAHSGKGIAATGDVYVSGNVAIAESQFPKAGIGLGIIGAIAIVVGLLLPQGKNCTSDSITTGGDLSARDISIEGGSGSIEC